MNERLSTGEQLAGGAGAALVLIMFLFAWFGFDVPGANGLDAFDAFSDWVNIVLLLAAFSGISLALFGSQMARVPISLSVIATVLGGLSAIVILVYVISPPGIPTFGEAGLEVDLDREIGVWLGLIAAICLAIGGYLTMQEEGTTFADAADSLSGSPGAGQAPHPPAGSPPPPPPAPPYAGSPPPPPPPGPGVQ